MIDEYWTWEFYGYHSDEVSFGSGKPIVAVCEKCGKYRVLRYQEYNDLCKSCVRKGIPRSKETIKKMSDSQLGKTIPQEQRDQISVTLTGRKMSYESRCKKSAVAQGISLNEWEGFAHEQKYCPAFNESIKERVRDKYERLCFVCGKTEEENLATHNEKLSVHHTDMQKQQGCDGHEWKLVPLCKVCHSTAHYEPMKARIEYIRYSEEMP